MVLIGGGIAIRRQAVLLRPGGISSLEYHLFVDLSRWRSISSEKGTQTTKAARNEQVSALRTRVGINPLCQEQSVVADEDLFLLLRPAYETWVWGAGAQQETPHRTLHLAPKRCPKDGAVSRLHVFST